MAEAETQDSEAEEEQETFAWAGQTPHTRIGGNVTGLIYPGQVSSNEEQNDSSFGLILEQPEVQIGTLFVNEQKPSGETMADTVDDDSPSVPTDYRIADVDDRDADFDRDGNLKTGEESTVDGDEANVYVEADDIEEDTIIVWYNGMSAERLGRTLDFNGRPFARWTDDDDPYLVKGLVQVADGWRDGGSSTRSDLNQSGKGPRVVRFPILRNRVEYTEDDDGDIESATLLDEPKPLDITVDLSRFQGGRGYEIHVFDTEALEDELGSLDAELPRNDDGYVDDIDAELEMPYSPRADEVLEQAGYSMAMFTGDGWQDEPTNWSPQSTSEVDRFGIGDDGGSGGESQSSDGLTAKQEQFVEEVVGLLKGSGQTPDEAFDGGIAGLIGKYSSDFDSVPDTDTVRREVYDRVEYLSTDSLEE